MGANTSLKLLEKPLVEGKQVRWTGSSDETETVW